MKRVTHNQGLYTGGCGGRPFEADAKRRLAAIAEVVARPRGSRPTAVPHQGRSGFTRSVDTLFHIARERAGVIHWMGARLGAILLFIYAWAVALTTRLVSRGFPAWPYLPARCVMAVWHGSAPSLLAAILAYRPRAPIAIMVSRDPRGDCLALLCRMLRLRVVRGGSHGSGWEALAELAREMERGACVLITADGEGPARVAKVGAVALASATGAQLIAIGADCRPAVYEHRKWDRARNPLPFGRIAIAVGQPLSLPFLDDVETLEEARLLLQGSLEEATLSACCSDVKGGRVGSTSRA